VIIVGLLLVMLPRESHAAATALPLLQSSTLDQSNDLTRPYSLSAAGFLQAQTFTAGRTGLLDRIELLGEGREASEVAIQIKAVDGSGLPTGPALGSGSINTPIVAVWTSVSIEPAVPVRAGVQYAIVKPNGTPSTFFWAFSLPTNPYPGGVSVQFSAAYVSDVNDFAFRTYMGPNTAPVAGDDSYTTNEGTELTGSVLSNDSDVDGTPLTAVKVSDPAHGDLTLDNNGDFTYTPDANFFGTDSFMYKANDVIADSNVATVTITVNAVNDLPLAQDDSYSTTEDTALTINAPGVLQNDSDAEGSALTAVKGSDPAHGTLTLNGDGSFTYTPAANYSGPDSFSYKANDGTADSNVATVNITVNDAPTASPSQAPAANTNGWNATNVTVTWNWTDTVGGIDSANCTTVSTSSGEGEQTLSASCADLAGNLGSASYTVKVDTTAPMISAATTTAPNTAGWYNAPVTVQFTCTDTLSSIPQGACPPDQSLSGDGSAVSSTAQSVSDVAGNSATSNIVTVQIDTTAPTLAPTVSPSPVRLGIPASASPNASDVLSGIASQSCGPLDTSSLGLKSVSCTATDLAGNSASASVSYEVLAPGCGGQSATIYVNGQGRIVGGKDNGKIYTGLLNGTTGNDVIVGTGGNDQVDAKAGNDVICGLGGDDRLTGDDGADIIYGGEGRDTLKGSGHNDTMYGEGGDDNLDGDSGADMLDGGAGADFLDGDGENDTLTGGLGADHFKGGSGNDTATDFTPVQGDTRNSVERP
jgi:VCBS repeat-containing protein